MRNPTLYATVKQYCDEAFTMLGDSLRDAPDLPTRLTAQLNIEDKHRYSYIHVPEVDWSIVVVRLRDQILALPAYAAAVAEFESDERICSQLGVLVGTSSGSGSRQVSAEDCLRLTLTRLLETANRFELDEEVFRATYGELEDSFYADTFECRLTAPVSGLDMDHDRLDLGAGLAIVRISSEELEEAISRSLYLSTPHGYDSGLPRFAFELLLEVPKHVGNHPPISDPQGPEIARHRFTELLSALRLFKSGDLFFNTISVELQRSFAFGGSMFSWQHGRPSSSPGMYYLGESETHAFKWLWNLFREITRLERKRLQVAVNRLGFGLERRDPTDRLVDFVIAFEALLLGDQQELRYKLSLRVSHLLGKTAAERVAIFEIIAAAYKQRNNIVHGSYPDKTVEIAGEKYDFRRLVHSTEQYLRQAILEFLKRSKAQTEKQIRDDLDAAIIRSGTTV